MVIVRRHVVTLPGGKRSVMKANSGASKYIPAKCSIPIKSAATPQTHSLPFVMWGKSLCAGMCDSAFQKGLATHAPHKMASPAVCTSA